MMEIRHPAIVGEIVRAQDEMVKKAVFDKAVKIFGKDCVFIADCIKQVMTEHFLKCEDPNLQAAFMRVAIAAKEMNYPTKLDRRLKAGFKNKKK